MRILLVVLLLVSRGAMAGLPASPLDPCGPAISSAEAQMRLPAQLLHTIAIVESGRSDVVAGRVIPWPWSINVSGTDHVYGSKAEAIAAVQGFQAGGARSIDVGCMQINLQYHPNAFASLDEAFDPQANATYGAGFLRALFGQLGNWPRAAAAYHSQTPDIGQGYEARVMALWPLAGKFPDAGLARCGVAAGLVEDGVYTPEFAAELRQGRKDLARLAETHTLMVVPDGLVRRIEKGKSVSNVARCGVPLDGQRRLQTAQR